MADPPRRQDEVPVGASVIGGKEGPTEILFEETSLPGLMQQSAIVMTFIGLLVLAVVAPLVSPENGMFVRFLLVLAALSVAVLTLLFGRITLRVEHGRFVVSQGPLRHSFPATEIAAVRTGRRTPLGVSTAEGPLVLGRTCRIVNRFGHVLVIDRVRAAPVVLSPVRVEAARRALLKMWTEVHPPEDQIVAAAREPVT